MCVYIYNDRGNIDRHEKFHPSLCCDSFSLSIYLSSYVSLVPTLGHTHTRSKHTPRIHWGVHLRETLWLWCEVPCGLSHPTVFFVIWTTKPRVCCRPGVSRLIQSGWPENGKPIPCKGVRLQWAHARFSRNGPSKTFCGGAFATPGPLWAHPCRDPSS